MPNNVMNPDSVVLQQVDGMWQKLAALIVWKLAREGVTITHKDMDEFARGDNVLLTHGHFDSIEFKIVTAEAARRIAAHDAKMNDNHG